MILQPTMFEIQDQTYQNGGHGKFGAKAHYYSSEEHAKKKTDRQEWFLDAILKFGKDKEIVAISYNRNCKSVYLHTKIEPDKIISKRNTPEKSKRHNHHVFVKMVRQQSTL